MHILSFMSFVIHLSKHGTGRDGFDRARKMAVGVCISRGEGGRGGLDYRPVYVPVTSQALQCVTQGIVTRSRDGCSVR